MRKKGLMLILFVILTIIFISTNITAAEVSVKQYAYDNYQSYQDPLFYSIANISQLNWDWVDWSIMDYNREELYSEGHIYQNLNDNAYQKLNYNYINYTHHNFNQSRISGSKYLLDKGLKNSKLYIANKKITIQYSKNRITHPNGDFVSIPGPYPNRTQFQFFQERIKIILPKNTTNIDDILAGVKQGTYEDSIEIFSEEIGNLNFINGQAYVKGGEEACFNYYCIPAQDNDVFIYFDGQEHEGNYVSLGDTTIKMGSTENEQTRLIPKPGNKFFHMVKRKDLPNGNYKWVADDRDDINLEVNGGNSLTIQNRDLLSETPLITSSSTDQGHTTILTGRGMEINDQKGDILINPPTPIPEEEGPFDETNSVPFEFKTKDKKHRLIVSSSNRAKLTTKTDQGEITVLDFSGNSKVTTDLEFNMIKTIDDLRRKYPNIQFDTKEYQMEIKEKPGVIDNPYLLDIPYDIKGIFVDNPNYTRISPNMAQAMTEWFEKNPKKTKYIKKVYFNTEMNAYHVGHGKGTIGFGERVMDPTTLKNRPIRYSTDILSTADHEVDHMIDSYLYKEEDQEIRKAYDYFEQKENNPFGSILPTLSKDEEMQEIIDKKTVDDKYEEALIPLLKKIVQKKEYKECIKLWQRYIIKESKQGKKFYNYENISMENIKEELNDNFTISATLLFNRFGGNKTIQARYKKNDEVIKCKELLEKATKEEFYLGTYIFSGPPYSEASTVSLEPSPEVAAVMIANGNEFQRQTTQLAYDTGKIGKLEYYKRMGTYCSNNPCGKCLEYIWHCDPNKPHPWEE